MSRQYNKKDFIIHSKAFIWIVGEREKQGQIDRDSEREKLKGVNKEVDWDKQGEGEKQPGIDRQIDRQIEIN